MRRALLFSAALLLLGAIFARPAFPQRFGRNRVQYQTFDFQVLQTPHFNLHFYPEAEVGALDMGRMAERWNERLEPLFQRQLPSSTPIIVYADHPDFQQTNVIEAMIGEGVGGFTEPLRNRLVMPMTGIYEDNDHVLGHELVHVFQFDSARQTGLGITSMRQVPLWFSEGLSEYLSLGQHNPHTAMWLLDAVVRGDIPGTGALTNAPYRYNPYRFGHALCAFIAGSVGDEALLNLYLATLAQGFSAAVRSVLNTSPQLLSQAWAEALVSRYEPLL